MAASTTKSTTTSTRNGSTPAQDLSRAPRPTGLATSADASPAPYHCATCGSDSPYVGRKPVHKGGRGCKACSAVEKQINLALTTAMRAITREAYEGNLIGDAKIAIMTRGEQAGRAAWRAAQISFGIDLDREEREAGMAVGATAAPAPAAQLLAPRPTTAVQVRYDGPESFGASASGGSTADVTAAIVAEMRAMAAAGLIGPAALTDVATDLMNVAQDMSLAGSAVAA